MRGSTSHRVDWAAMRPGHPAREFRQWRRERAMMAALGALEDGALKDIGICRGDIPCLAHGAGGRGGSLVVREIGRPAAA